MATQFGILASKIPGREEPGRLQFKSSQRVTHDGATKHNLRHSTGLPRWLRE